mmetsp:Transcript_30574/g.64076  ORF Transcript_30574/g.64076 Transcript_30574/m.64076 type:complete len:118 (-) Transcript_30574:2935-3288(-)
MSQQLLTTVGLIEIASIQNVVRIYEKDAVIVDCICSFKNVVTPSNTFACRNRNIRIADTSFPSARIRVLTVLMITILAHRFFLPVMNLIFTKVIIVKVIRSICIPWTPLSIMMMISI